MEILPTKEGSAAVFPESQITNKYLQVLCQSIIAIPSTVRFL